MVLKSYDLLSVAAAKVKCGRHLGVLKRVLGVLGEIWNRREPIELWLGFYVT